MVRSSWQEWALAAIGLVAMAAISIYPFGWSNLPSGRILLWPQFLLHGVLLLAWIGVAGTALVRRALPLPLAMTSAVLAMMPLLFLAPQWNCVSGQCFW